MWDELKNGPIIWKFIAFVAIPIAAMFACITVSLTGYQILNRSINKTQPATQEVIVDASASTVIPTSESPPTPPTSKSYELNWKIEDNQPIAYNTAMEIVDSNSSFDFGQMLNSDQSGKDDEVSSYFQEMFEDIKDSQPAYSLVSILEKTSQGNISIKMILDNIEATELGSDDFMEQMLQSMEGRVQLQGEITPEGEIASPYLAQQQKNLLALFFELPTSPVEVGDTWQIDLTCITVNSAQYTIENSEIVNQVTFSELMETPEGEPVAILDYLIVESVDGEQSIPLFSTEPAPFSMKCSFVGRGEFLIEQGRWQQYSSEFTIQSTGMITSEVTQHLALSPLDEVPDFSENIDQQALIDPSFTDSTKQEDGLQLGLCRFISTEVAEPSSEDAVMWYGGYNYDGPPNSPLPVEASITLNYIGESLPETLVVHGKTFSLASDEPIQFTIPIDPNGPPLPLVDLTLMTVEDDIEEPIILNVGGKEYQLNLEPVRDEFAFGSASNDEGDCIYTSPEITQIAIDAMNQNFDTAEEYVNQGVYEYQTDNMEAAIENFTKAIELDPMFVDAYYNRGRSYYSINDLDQAIADFDKTIELAPHYANAYYMRASVYHNSDELEQAIQDYTKAIELDSGLVNAYYYRGGIYQGRYELMKAIEDYDTVVELSPDFGDVYYYRGTVYRELGETKQAHQDYTKTIELNPNFAEAYYSRGMINYGLGNQQQALLDLKKYLVLDPETSSRSSVENLIQQIESELGQ